MAVYSLSYAYITGYIFNWLVNVRPRLRNYRAQYDAARSILWGIATNADGLVEDLNFASGIIATPRNNILALNQALAKIGMGNIADPPLESAQAIVRRRLRMHRELYQKIAPMLHSFEPSLAAALAAVDASPALDDLYDVPYKPNAGADEMLFAGDDVAHARYWLSVHSYQQVCQYLQETLRRQSKEATSWICIPQQLQIKPKRYTQPPTDPLDSPG